MPLLPVLAVILVAYLLGAIPFGLLVARAFGITDVRSHGSGNIGATNVWRVAGARAAVWVYLLDIGKGILAVSLARLIPQTLLPAEVLLVLAGLAAVFGHVFPVYLGFRGGKGVNTGLGVILSLLPLETIAALVIFISVLAVSKFVSLGSISAALVLAALVAAERLWFRPETPAIYLALTVCLAVMILFTHRHNIRRLLDGTENRFAFKARDKHQPETGPHV